MALRLCINLDAVQTTSLFVQLQDQHTPPFSFHLGRACPRLTLVPQTLMSHPTCARNIANRGACDMTENSLNFRPEFKCNPPIDTQTNNEPD